MIGSFLGLVLLIEAALMVLPMIVALCYGESVFPFLITIGILVLVGLPTRIFRPKNRSFFAKEGFLSVAGSWILMSLFGALPFIFSGAIPNYIDAIFETVSGFTTTGSTILPVIEGLPKSILFWRSLTHWVGGMGVLVFMLAILPGSDGTAIHLMRAEVPGPTKGKLVPRLRSTALILYGIYMALTLVELILLLCTGFSFYDATVTTFATAGTGGFSVLNASIAGYANPAAEWIIGVFMLLFGINFNIYYFLLIRRGREVLKNEELWTYLALAFVSVAAIAVNTRHLFASFGVTLRSAFFQVTSIMSTTGFATVDFGTWPAFSKGVILLLMLVGACAGSTAGGLKISRILILMKSAVREIKHLLRPRSINRVRMDGEVVSKETCHSAANYLTLYCGILILSFLVISVDGFSVETNLSAAISCLNNIGPALGDIGPMGNFSGFSYLSKIVLTFDMLLGRLEIMPMVILLSPIAWRK